jgi:hypothetical protein
MKLFSRYIIFINGLLLLTTLLALVVRSFTTLPASLSMRCRALHRWIGESENQNRQTRPHRRGHRRSRYHTLPIGIQIECRTALFDPTGISALLRQTT